MEFSLPFQSFSIEETFRHFKTSNKGLSKEEVQKRLSLYGKNLLREEKVSKWRIFFRQFNNFLIYVLVAASLVSLSIGAWTDFFAIISIIIANALIGFWQEIKAESSITALKKMTESKSQVIRDGHLQLIASSLLVPGDYIVLHEGEVISADIRLVENNGLMLNESTLTGESIPVFKDASLLLPKNALPYELQNMLLTGTYVARGTGQGIVVHTAHNTYLAKIAEKLQEPSPETPLTKALNFFTKKALIIFISFFSFLGILGYFQGRSLLELSYILLASLVSAVPEGLPIVITLVMVIGAIALSRRHALVRYLPSVETLGSVTVIASDKTGTITEGKLIVKEVFSHHLEELRQIAALCNDSHENSGDPLDVALLHWAKNAENLRKKYPRKISFPFDSRQMYMATVHEIEGASTLLIKGAFEMLREKAENREELPELEKNFHAFLKQGLRVLAFGSGKWENKDPSSWKIRLIGLIGFLDPPKSGVKEAVLMAQKAHIRVFMITGDHPATATAIASEVGIGSKEDAYLSGKEVETFSDSSLLQALKKINVLARILPEHKYKIVKLLQAHGEIVAVTGDGVNDIPALKAADIGIAMGSGAEAAKSAAKMILTDNNLSVIVTAIKNARVIADNIRKVIYYLTATALQEITLIFLSVLSELPIPLAAIQILWINLVTDGVQDKTFPFAKEEGNVMDRKPRKPEKQFFDRKQIIKIAFFGIPIGTLCFFLYEHLLLLYSYEVASSIIFTGVVMAQWANGIQSQKESEPFFKNIKRSFSINPFIFWGLAIGIALQLFALYVAPKAFHSFPLSLEHWKYPLFVFFSAFTLVEIRKWFALSLSKFFPNL